MFQNEYVALNYISMALQRLHSNVSMLYWIIFQWCYSIGFQQRGHIGIYWRNFASYAPIILINLLLDAVSTKTRCITLSSCFINLLAFLWLYMHIVVNHLLKQFYPGQLWLINIKRVSLGIWMVGSRFMVMHYDRCGWLFGGVVVGGVGGAICVLFWGRVVFGTLV